MGLVSLPTLEWFEVIMIGIIWHNYIYIYYVCVRAMVKLLVEQKKIEQGKTDKGPDERLVPWPSVFF